MPYMVDASDKPGAAATRAKVRPEHLAYLDANQSKLLAAGAKLSDDGQTAFGSFYIVDTDDRAAAEAFLKGDPFMREGVFGSFTITRWRKAIFNFLRTPPK